MRQITVDFSSPTSPLFAGYIGEHNATELITTKPEELSGEMYSLAFMTNGEVIHSKFFSADEEIRVLLWKQLTQENILYVQLEAYKENGAYLGKSAKVKLLLSNSVHGTDVVADMDNPDIYAEIAQNSLFRESLENNVNTLDKLTTSKDGKLLFNGEELEGGARVTDHSELTGRDIENQHPISAIENLQKELDARRKVSEKIPAEEIGYSNNSLADDSGNIKGALDEAVAFVTSELPGLVAEKHIHSNKNALDGLGEDSAGGLTYKGKPVGATAPELHMIEAIVDGDDATIHNQTPATLTIERNMPHNARVKRVEIPDIVNQTDEYIALEDMISKDPGYGLEAPYFVMYPQNRIGMYGVGIVAGVVFPTYVPNSYYEQVDSFLGKTIKIYYELED